MTDPKTQIDRINEISAIARTSWLALLGYLAFIGISLLAVEDADFFVETRRTDLPLVGVAIPTYSFFFFAPILAAALYIYLQVHLLKLWDAIADAPATDRQPPARRAPPPLDRQRLRARTSRATAPSAPPAALARQPRHPPARLDRRPLCHRRLLVALDAGPRRMASPSPSPPPSSSPLYVGLTSSWTAPRPPPLPRPHAGPLGRRAPPPGRHRPALRVAVDSWLRTEAGLDHYANRLVDLADAAFGTEFSPRTAGTYTEILRHARTRREPPTTASSPIW